MIGMSEDELSTRLALEFERATMTSLYVPGQSEILKIVAAGVAKVIDENNKYIEKQLKEIKENR
jgi:hypothetical protein